MRNKILQTAAAKIITGFLGLFVTVIITRSLGASGMGTVSLIIATIGVIVMVSGFAGGAALVYLVPRQNTIQLIAISYLWAALVSLGAYLILSFSQILPEYLIIHLCLLSLLYSFITINSMVFLGKEAIAAVNRISLMQFLLHLAVIAFLFLVAKRKGISSFILSLYLAYGLTLIFSLLGIRKYLGNLSLSGINDTMRRILGYGFIAQFANIIQFLNYRLSFYILNHYLGVEAVGIYSVGVFLSEGICLVAGSISLVLYTKIANTKDLEYAKATTVKFAKLSFLVTAAILIPALLFPAGLFSFIFGRDFSSIKIVMLYMSLGILSYSLTSVISHYFAGRGMYYVNAIAVALGLLVTVTFNLLLVPRYGFIGSAITSSLAYITASVFIVWRAINKEKFSFQGMKL